MVPPNLGPSNRLIRAAHAEREDLRRHREKLLAERETLRAELARIDSSLELVHEREALLDRLAGSGAEALQRGPAIRRAAVEVLASEPGRPDALHYRDWFQLLGRAGYNVAGKDPLAVFLTQLSRSPVVRRSSQAGVYELDRSAPRRLRRRLEALHEELRRLAAPGGATTDLAAVRARRAEVHAEIGQVEKALEEAAAFLGELVDEPLRAAS
jgi:chromosome segregation ATPase